jgi:hypothetical protein
MVTFFQEEASHLTRRDALAVNADANGIPGESSNPKRTIISENEYEAMHCRESEPKRPVGREARLERQDTPRIRRSVEKNPVR